jgi:processive 1,2-diacylglycerol beta-glucosyltransferase
MAMESLALGALTRQLRVQQPTAVICTHFLPAQVLMRRLPGVPVWTVVTDIDLHCLWLHHGGAGVCVATDELAWRARERGYTGRVVVTGIPIMPGFTLPVPAVVTALDPERPVVALLSGGHGIGDLSALARRILALPTAPQVIALTGRNRALLERLRLLAVDLPGLHPLGFIENPQAVLAQADIAVGKPGGLTTAECLALGLPLVAVGAIPGQEEANADFLSASGAGIKAADTAAAVYQVGRLLFDPVARHVMRRRALAQAKPRAADAVLDAVLG